MSEPEHGPGDPVWHLYVVRTGEGSLYTGIATDVERRLAEHRGASGRGARYLRGRGPLELAFRRSIGDRGLAQRVEHRMQRLSREEKEKILEAGPTRRRLLKILELGRGSGGLTDWPDL